MPYTIGEVARMMNIAPSTLRYYEKEGLLSLGVRASNGQRTYTDGDVATLSIIEYLKFCGLPLKESATTSARRSRRCKQSSNVWNSAAGSTRPRSSTVRFCRCMNFQRSTFLRNIAMSCGRAFACRSRTCGQSLNGEVKKES